MSVFLRSPSDNPYDHGTLGSPGLKMGVPFGLRE